MNVLSSLAYNDFVDWLDFILKSGNIENMAADLIDNHDFSANHRIEVSAKYTKSGKPEIYTFDDLDVDF